jgi:2-C-methyl-D-erythritol 4-phosphate cytidylyltransferase
VPLAGRPMVRWSIDAFRACDSVGSIVVAAPPGHERALAGVGSAPGAERDLRVLAGGLTRAESVANAMAAVETELVAIHDAARPLLSPELVESLVALLGAAPGAAGAIAATPIVDTVKRAADTSLVVERTEDRAGLWAAQTPQVFRTEALRDAIAAAPGYERATDEAMLVEAAGGAVLIHPCETPNLKITTKFDLRIAEMLLGD